MIVRLRTAFSMKDFSVISVSSLRRSTLCDSHFLRPQSDSLYVHGSAASRMLRQMKDGVPVCISVTLLDGLVLARSVFNHSMNYRSVVILGKATLVDDAAEKLEA